MVFQYVMLSPCTHIAVASVRGVHEKVNFATRAGGIGEGTFQSRAVHTKVGRTTIGNGARQGIGLEDHGLRGFSVPVGSHEVDCMFGARVGGRSVGVASDGSGVGIDV